MGLTISNGPLSRQDAAVVSNYRSDGPEHLLLFVDVPRRVRAVFDDVAVLDIARGHLLHETGSLPVLYVPEDDVTASVLQPADHVTQSDATHWTVEVGHRSAAPAVRRQAPRVPGSLLGRYGRGCAGVSRRGYSADTMHNPMQGMSSKMVLAITIMSIMLVVMIVGVAVNHINHRKSGSSD